LNGLHTVRGYDLIL